jgi:DNA-binding NtrC family response regulator
MAERILLVDDEDKQRIPLRRILQDWGYEVEDCSSVESALGRIGQFLPSVVITDLVMPGGSGVDLLRKIRDDYRGSVIVLSGKGTISQAVEAMKEGADDYLEKPLDFRKLRVLLDKARGKNEIVEENRRLREQLTHGGTFGRLRGVSKKMLEVYSVIEQVAPSNIPVLITGESGTGKELVARTIHELSSRRGGPFVAINAAAIPRELIESELFGHERGAFTGAIARKIGCFEMANAGTLFLDEIAEMEEGTQAKLLRVLQEQSFRRIGGSELIQSDVRVLAATNRDPKLAMADKKLRKDLYYRLAVINVQLPPLRDRDDDILLLAWSFVEEVCRNAGKKPPQFAPETKDILARHRWPGNVRELRNAIERALVLTNGSTILPEQLPAEVLSDVGWVAPAGSGASRTMIAAVESGVSARANDAAEAAFGAAGTGGNGAPSRPAAGMDGAGSSGDGTGGAGPDAGSLDGELATAFTVPLGTSAADVERELIRRTLEMTGGNKTKAAKILGLSLKTIHNKAKKFNL